MPLPHEALSPQLEHKSLLVLPQDCCIYLCITIAYVNLISSILFEAPTISASYINAINTGLITWPHWIWLTGSHILSPKDDSNFWYEIEPWRTPSCKNILFGKRGSVTLQQVVQGNFQWSLYTEISETWILLLMTFWTSQVEMSSEPLL